MFKGERLLILIPIHNYEEGVLRLVEFAKSNLYKYFEHWKCVLVNNNSNESCTSILKNIATHPNFIYVEQKVPKNLKLNFHIGYTIGCTHIKPTIVSIWETDAVPNMNTFKSMISVFIEERKNNVASVSPMYTWRGKYCYPTHSHWHSDPIYKRHKLYGEITKVHAVPFVFSVWDPSVMININGNDTQNFCPFLQLCRDWGVKLTNEGKKHLRLKNYPIEHWGGGKMTRRNR